MAPTLYLVTSSPPVRSVLLCAKAIGLKLNLKYIDVFNGEHLKPEYLKINPQHTIPTLIDDDGFILWESHAIMVYLLTKYGQGKEALYPNDPKKRAIVDQRLHFDTGVLFARGLAISYDILFNGAKEVTQSSKQKLAEAYDFVEKFLENNKWIAGDEMTLADFSFVTSISSWQVFEPVSETKYPRITAWLKQMEDLPYYDEANREGLESYYTLMKEKLKTKS